MANDLQDHLTEIAMALKDVDRELRLRVDRQGEQLNGTEGTLMRFVHRNPGCTPTQACAGTGLSRAKVSTTLRHLRERGFLETSPVEGDGRGIRMRTTPQADANLERLRLRWASLLDEAWAHEPGSLDDLAATRRTLETLARRLAAAPRE